MNEVWLDNQSGWELASLEGFRQFPGVLRVDGHTLMSGGRFRYAVIFFGNEADAAEFAKNAGDAAQPWRK